MKCYRRTACTMPDNTTTFHLLIAAAQSMVEFEIALIKRRNALSFFVNGSFFTMIPGGTYTKESIFFACYTGSTSQIQSVFSNLKVHIL